MRQSRTARGHHEGLQEGLMFAEMEAIITRVPEFASRCNLQRFRVRLWCLGDPRRGQERAPWQRQDRLKLDGYTSEGGAEVGRNAPRKQDEGARQRRRSIALAWREAFRGPLVAIAAIIPTGAGR